VFDLARHDARLVLQNGRVGVQGDLPAELLLRCTAIGATCCRWSNAAIA